MVYSTHANEGVTGLITGKRVSKDALRIEACGSVDEVNAVLGVARSYGPPEQVEIILRRIQDTLFTVGSNLSLAEGVSAKEWGIPELTDDDVQELEKEIGNYKASLEPLREFVLPGGSGAGAMLHLARTVARRAERRCVALARAEGVDPRILRYLNLLSDLLFLLARHTNRIASQPEVHPSFIRRSG